MKTKRISRTKIAQSMHEFRTICTFEMKMPIRAQLGNPYKKSAEIVRLQYIGNQILASKFCTIILFARFLLSI